MLGPQEPNGRQWKDDAAPRGRAPESLVLVLLAQNEYCVTLDSIAPAEALDLLRASVDEIAEDPASGPRRCSRQEGCVTSLLRPLWIG